MLRITIDETQEALTFRLEGKLAGPWVRELEECWQRTPAGRAGLAIRLDLTAVTFIDAAGKALLAAKHVQRAELVACGCLMRAVVAEITKTPIPTCNE